LASVVVAFAYVTLNVLLYVVIAIITTILLLLLGTGKWPKMCRVGR